MNCERVAARGFVAALAGVIAALVASCSGGGGGSESAGEDPAFTSDITLLDFEQYIVTGEPGGPFLPETKTYSVLNSSDEPIRWEASTTGEWIGVVGNSSGVLPPGSVAEVVLGFDAFLASAYPVGAFEGGVQFHVLNTGHVYSERTVLMVLNPNGSLTVDPTSRVRSTGQPGGPFDPVEHVYTLSNPGASRVDWSATSNQPWLTVRDPAGSVASGASIEATVELNLAVATTMPVGQYSAAVTFTNTTNGSGTTTRVVNLVVTTTPEGILTVTPAGGFLPSGPEGGPFTPPSKTYQLWNTGGLPLAFSTSVSGGWMSLHGAINGTLNAGQSAWTAVATAPSADGLPTGPHAGTIYFTNTTDGTGNTSQGATLSVAPSGWTALHPSPDSRRVYVSSSLGSDVNDGLSEQTPKATIDAGYALLRDGFPDWLQLRQGDTFNRSSGISFDKDGRSASEPLVLTSYGTANVRPKVFTNGQTGLAISDDSNIAVAHLEMDPTDGNATFRPDGTNPRAVFIFSNCDDILIEGCLFTNFGAGVECGPLSMAEANSNIALRRNVFDSTYAIGSGESQGILVRYTNGLLMEENYLDHNGWNEDDPRAVPPTGLSHAIYIQHNNSNCVMRGNVITWPASAGAQCRSGGLIEDNFVTKAAGAFRIGGAGGPDEPSGWVQATMQRNVIVDGFDNEGAVHVYEGVRIHNADGVTLRDNIFANTPQSPTNQARAITIQPHNSYGNRTITIERNIVYDWGNRAVVLLTHGATEAWGWSFIDNDFQDPLSPGIDLLYATTTTESSAIAESRDNEYWGTAVQSDWFNIQAINYNLAQLNTLVGDTTSVANETSYLDSTRGVESYMTSLGTGSSLQDFIEEMLQQSQHNWRQEYTSYALNSYIREGFGVSSN